VGLYVHRTLSCPYRDDHDRLAPANGPHLVALVRAGAKFEKGVLVERPDEAEFKVAA
jgi:hypothetical protein